MSCASALVRRRLAMFTFLACCAAAGPAVTNLLIDLSHMIVCAVRAGGAA